MTLKRASTELLCEWHADIVAELHRRILLEAGSTTPPWAAAARTGLDRTLADVADVADVAAGRADREESLRAQGFEPPTRTLADVDRGIAANRHRAQQQEPPPRQQRIVASTEGRSTSVQEMPQALDRVRRPPGQVYATGKTDPEAAAIWAARAGSPLGPPEGE